MYEKPEKCPICWEASLSDNDRLKCGHWVHIGCIKKCDAARCPLCRADLDIELNKPFVKEETFLIPEIDLDMPRPYSKYRDEVYQIHQSLLDFKRMFGESAHEFIDYDIDFVANVCDEEEIDHSEVVACKEALLRARHNDCMAHDHYESDSYNYSDYESDYE